MPCIVPTGSPTTSLAPSVSSAISSTVDFSCNSQCTTLRQSTVEARGTNYPTHKRSVIYFRPKLSRVLKFWQHWTHGKLFSGRTVRCQCGDGGGGEFVQWWRQCNGWCARIQSWFIGNGIVAYIHAIRSQAWQRFCKPKQRGLET